MWTFKDKGERDVCLIPEVTGLCQEMWRDKWKSQYKYRKLFYCARAYRYERPQKGRYREFTQFGIEILGDYKDAEIECKELLTSCLEAVEADYIFDSSVKRGLGYYTELGFEAVCENLGAQKQIAGGGKYQEGIGWAIGIDRLVLSLLTE